jgi:hypothetical protein
VRNSSTLDGPCNRTALQICRRNGNGSESKGDSCAVGDLKERVDVEEVGEYARLDSGEDMATINAKHQRIMRTFWAV